MKKKKDTREKLSTSNQNFKPITRRLSPSRDARGGGGVEVVHRLSKTLLQQLDFFLVLKADFLFFIFFFTITSHTNVLFFLFLFLSSFYFVSLHGIFEEQGEEDFRTPTPPVDEIKPFQGQVVTWKAGIFPPRC